jgi:hypothetical protein
VSEQTQFSQEMFTLGPAQAAAFGRANRALGALALMGRLEPLWAGFAAGPLGGLALQAECRLAGQNPDLGELLALALNPRPPGPGQIPRLALAAQAAWREMTAWPAGKPLDAGAVARLHQELEPSQKPRVPGLAPSPNQEFPGAEVWARALAWRRAGLPALGVVALALAAWEREGPHGPRHLSGRIMATGLARGLGLAPASFVLLGPCLQQAARPGGLEDLYGPLRAGEGWRPWLEAFWEAAAASAGRALELGLALNQMLEQHRRLIRPLRAPRHPLALLDLLAVRGVVDLPSVATELQVTHRTAGLLMDKLSGLGLTEEITGQKRGRRYAYRPLMELLTV